MPFDSAGDGSLGRGAFHRTQAPPIYRQQRCKLTALSHQLLKRNEAIPHELT